MTTIERFLTHVDKSGSCWTWTASKFRDGYGQFKLKRRNRRAHQVAYELFVGPIPKGLQCLHHCDRRECVFPDHLFIGTNDDNVSDKVKKQRQAKGESLSRAIKPNAKRGIDNHAHKLTDEQIVQIRKLYQFGKVGSGTPTLARAYGVSGPTIHAIVRGEIWKHVT